MAMSQKHPHYHKDVASFKTIDVYRVLGLFGVTDPCIQHAIKKLLVAGGRGAGKDIFRDVREAMDSLERYMEIQMEDEVAEFEKKQAELPTVNLSTETSSDSIDRLSEHLKDLGKRTAIPVVDPVRVARKQARKKMPATVKKDLARNKRAQAASKRALRNR